MTTPIVTANITFEKETDFNDQEFFDQNIQSLIKDKDQNGFTIVLNKVAPQDINFSWIALAVKDAKIYESTIDGLIIEEINDTTDDVTDTTDDNEEDVIDETIDDGIENIYDVVEDVIDENVVEEVVSDTTEEEIVTEEVSGSVPEIIPEPEPVQETITEPEIISDTTLSE